MGSMNTAPSWMRHRGLRAAEGLADVVIPDSEPAFDRQDDGSLLSRAGESSVGVPVDQTAGLRANQYRSGTADWNTGMSLAELEQDTSARGLINDRYKQSLAAIGPDMYEKVRADELANLSHENAMAKQALMGDTLALQADRMQPATPDDMNAAGVSGMLTRGEALEDQIRQAGEGRKFSLEEARFQNYLDRERAKAEAAQGVQRQRDTSAERVAGIRGDATRDAASIRTGAPVTPKGDSIVQEYQRAVDSWRRAFANGKISKAEHDKRINDLTLEFTRAAQQP